MSITKDINGNIVEGPFDQKDEFERSGSVRTDVFSIVDPIKRLKQVRFDTSALPDATNVTLKANPSTSGDVIITLPAVSGTLSTGGGGGGDVSGPGSSTDKAVARWSGTDGTTIQDSAVVIDDSGNLTATNLSGSLSGSSSGTNTGDITITDSNSVNLTLVGQAISADVNLADSTLTEVVGGIKVATGGITDTQLASGIDAAKIADGSVSNTEFQYLDGVTSAIQTQLGTKVVGPASASDNAIARYDSTTGKLIQNSLPTIDDVGLLTTPDLDVLDNASFGNIVEINTIPYSFPASQGSADDVLTNDGSGNLSWSPPAASSSQIVEQFVLDSTDISNKFITLTNAPTAPNYTILLVADAGNMYYGDDFSVTGSQLSWTSLALDGILISGDKLTVTYN